MFEKGVKVVYRVIERQDAKPEDLEKDRKQIQEQVLQSKRSVAYEAFRSALQDRMKREGKLRMIPENLKGLGSSF